MKFLKTYLYVTLALVSLPGIAQGVEINRLVLYNDQALISFDRVIEGHLLITAPPELLPGSVVVSPRTGGSIGAISIEPERTQSGKVKDIQETLQKKQSALALMKKDQAMLEKQIDIIYDAAGSKGKAAAFEKTRLADALGFIEHKVNALNTRIVELAKKSEKLETEIKDLQNQLDKVSRNPGYLIDVTGNGPVVVSYVVRAASWKPEYKVYALPGTSKMIIESSVQARQSTGSDWDIREMMVSTGKPSFGIEAPELTPWYVYKTPQRVARFKAESSDMAAPLAAAAPMEEDEAATLATTTSYLIGAAKNIRLAGDGTPVTVKLTKLDLGAEFSLTTIPKYSESAYLRAELTIAGDMPLVPGPYSSFVDGVFSGNGRIKRAEPGLKMTLDLGIDEGITVKRKETRAFHDKTLTGRDRMTYSYEIAVENSRKQKTSITIKDQIPISRDRDIEVELLKTSPAATPDQDGILSWTIELDPRQKKTVGFSFSVIGDVSMLR